MDILFGRVAGLLLAIVIVNGCGAKTPGQATTPLAAHNPFQPHAFFVKVMGSGRPVIFIPGIACSGKVWDKTIEHLAGKVEAHVITLAGFAGRPRISAPFLSTVR